MTEVVVPIELHALSAKNKRQLQAILDKVVSASIVKSRGKDLLLEVYLTGLYHGAKASQ